MRSDRANCRHREQVYIARQRITQSGEWGETVNQDDTKIYHSDFVVDEIQNNPPGRDVKHLNEEYVTFKNAGTTPLDISGWTVQNESGDRFSFPDRTTVKSGRHITLYSGPGQATATEFYWGSDRAMWRNEGDTVLVADETGRVRLRESYNE